MKLTYTKTARPQAAPKTTAQRQQALRERRAQEGMTEVRGIFLPPALHAELKDEARVKLTRWPARKAFNAKNHRGPQ